MRVRNEIDRYHIVIDIVKHLDIKDTPSGKRVTNIIKNKLKHNN